MTVLLGLSFLGDQNLKSNPISSPFCNLLNAGLKTAWNRLRSKTPHISGCSRKVFGCPLSFGPPPPPPPGMELLKGCKDCRHVLPQGLDPEKLLQHLFLGCLKFWALIFAGT